MYFFFFQRLDVFRYKSLSGKRILYIVRHIKNRYKKALDEAQHNRMTGRHNVGRLFVQRSNSVANVAGKLR